MSSPGTSPSGSTTVHVDGPRPGCVCGPACELPCWQRVGITTDACCTGCTPLPNEDDT